jgi:hypothetical protein
MSPAEATHHARTLLSALEVRPDNAAEIVTLPIDDMVSGVATVARGPDRQYGGQLPKVRSYPVANARLGADGELENPRRWGMRV